ncbi:hypothetical protein GGR56DRAFT_312423 [Xylariaceae sp. FL0804]|nr:hypothetical protein GGR56DRAFT_312423 [Xylariaceae sp. FL0804]
MVIRRRRCRRSRGSAAPPQSLPAVATRRHERRRLLRLLRRPRPRLRPRRCCGCEHGAIPGWRRQVMTRWMLLLLLPRTRTRTRTSDRRATYLGTYLPKVLLRELGPLLHTYLLHEHLSTSTGPQTLMGDREGKEKNALATSAGSWCQPDGGPSLHCGHGWAWSERGTGTSRWWVMSVQIPYSATTDRNAGGNIYS